MKVKNLYRVIGAASLCLSVVFTPVAFAQFNECVDDGSGETEAQIYARYDACMNDAQTSSDEAVCGAQLVNDLNAMYASIDPDCP